MAVCFAGLLLAGCATPGIHRSFREQVRDRPDQGAWVDGVPAIPSRNLSHETACLHAMVLSRRKGSPRALARWQRKNEEYYSPQELPFRLAWSHHLFITRTAGNMEQIRHHLRHDTPALVALQQSALHPDTRRHELIVGYDDHHRVMLRRGSGRDSYTLIPYDQFEREWRIARNSMTVLLTPDFDSRPLTAMELFERARYHEAKGAQESAIADYRAAENAGLASSILYVRLGNTLRTAARPDEAAESYRKAISADPHNSQAYNNLAYLLAETGGNLDEATHLARQAMILDPANPLVLDTIGFVLYQQGRYREAADVLERARGRARWHPAEARAEIAFRLVRAHLRNGDVHLAREVFHDALRFSPADQVPSDLRELLR